jgi:hypothetical protein
LLAGAERIATIGHGHGRTQWVLIFNRIVTAATTAETEGCLNLVAELLSQCSKGADTMATDVPNGFPTIFIQVHLKGERGVWVPATGEVEKATDAVEELQLSPTFSDRAYCPIEFVNQAERAIESATAPAFAMEPS